MAKATQRRQLGVMGILGKHDKKTSWQEDFLDGRIVFWDQALPTGVSPEVPHLACRKTDWPFRPGHDGNKPESAGRWLGQSLGHLITPLHCPP